MKGVFDPGELIHRINVEMPIEATDGFGGMIVTWMPIASVWAALQPLATRFRQIAQQTNEEQSHSIAVRFRNDISSGWRFLLNQRIFAIDAVFDPDERKRFLICMTREEGR